MPDITALNLIQNTEKYTPDSAIGKAVAPLREFPLSKSQRACINQLNDVFIVAIARQLILNMPPEWKEAYLNA